MRADKILPGLSDNKGGAVKATVQVFAFNVAAKSGGAVKKAANYIAEGDEPVLLSDRVVAYDVPGLLQAKRRLADAAIEVERYLF